MVPIVLQKIGRFNRCLTVQKSKSSLVFFKRYASSSINVRVRFAPSPTGLLHLGGFRTALVNYLFALKHNGKFILRIEDTDQTRLVPNAIEMIEEDLNWLELFPDEGPSKVGSHGPYIQSQRKQSYYENIKTLIESGSAYECFCSETRLGLIRREALRQRQTPRYDNKCRELTREKVKSKKANGEKYCVRFKLQPDIVKFNDLVFGPVEFNLKDNNYEGDPVILKSDGFPTYHFANVVDDHLMEISHVLRGVEWQISTPKHLQLYKAFNWEAPQYGHLPLVMNKDGTKLSKRQGDISIRHYREQLYYPKALANFVTKSGGGFADHSVEKIYTVQQLANLFELEKVNSAACKLDFALLSHLNQVELLHQIVNNVDDVVLSLRSKVLLSSIPNPEAFSTSYLKDIVNWCPERVNSICDLLTPQFSYLWSLPGSNSLSKLTLEAKILQAFTIELEKYLNKVESNIVQSDKLNMSAFIQEYASINGINFKTLMRDIRLALCGIEKGPPIGDIIELFGKQNTINRLQEAVELISNFGNKSNKLVHS